MTFTFVSNYINHHQKPFCDAMYRVLGEEFTFVATMPMDEERIAMGWDVSLMELPYVRCLFRDAEVEELIYSSDCVLFGWSEREDIAARRLESGKLTMRVSERLYRDGRYKAISPRGLLAKYREHIKYRNKPVYLLCAGAYTAEDFALIHAYPDKMLKWGYFPPQRRYAAGELEAHKNMDNGLQLVWAGRFIPLKHPEYAIAAARALKDRNIPFHLHMIGSGEMEADIEAQVRDGLSDCVSLYGFMTPDEVRDLMEKCHIHLCTSNQLEGWGAVVNEGMNSGCVEIVSDRMGAVPFLIENGINGVTYSRDLVEELIKKVCFVAENWEKEKLLGLKAAETIKNEWNADFAAARLLEFIEGLAQGREKEVLAGFSTGPLSPAPVIKLR